MKIFKDLTDSDHGVKVLMIDSTTVRASQEASGALKKGIQPPRHKRRKHWADPEED